MQANTTQVLSYQIILPTAFVVQNAYISITKPDSTTLTDITVTVSPNTSALVQNLTYIYTPDMAGRYKIVWKAVVNGQLLQYVAYLWVVWTDVYDTIRQLLGTNVVSMPDVRIDKEYRNLVTEIFDYAPALPAFWSFTDAYQDGFDQGMAKLVAARIRPYIGGKRPTGEISLFKKGTTTVQYTVGTPKAIQTLEDQWIAQGMAILEANIPEIYLVGSQDRMGDEVMTRGNLAIGNDHPIGAWDARTIDIVGMAGGTEF